MRDTEIETQVWADFKKVAGQVIMVHHIAGYLGNTCDSDEWAFDKPIAVRVDKHATKFEIERWMDNEWCDPIWNITIIDYCHPEMPPEGIRSAWIYGTSYSNKGTQPETTSWRFETLPERLHRLARKYRHATKMIRHAIRGKVRLIDAEEDAV